MKTENKNAAFLPKTFLLAALALGGGAAVAPDARAEDRVCVEAGGGVIVKMRVRSRSYTGPWSGNIPSPKEHCMDVRRVPVGECYYVEIDPKLWRRSNYSCAHKPKEGTGYHRGKSVHWKISTTLWGNKCNAGRFPNGFHYNYDGKNIGNKPTLFYDRAVVKQQRSNASLDKFDWTNRGHNRCLPR